MSKKKEGIEIEKIKNQYIRNPKIRFFMSLWKLALFEGGAEPTPPSF